MEPTQDQLTTLRSLVSDLSAGIEAPATLEDLRGYATKISNKINEFLKPVKGAKATKKVRV